MRLIAIPAPPLRHPLWACQGELKSDSLANKDLCAVVFRLARACNSDMRPISLISNRDLNILFSRGIEPSQVALRPFTVVHIVTCCRIPLLTSEDRSPSSRNSTKKEFKKRRRHPVAKVKGNWVVDEDLRLVR